MQKNLWDYFRHIIVSTLFVGKVLPPLLNCFGTFIQNISWTNICWSAFVFSVFPIGLFVFPPSSTIFLVAITVFVCVHAKSLQSCLTLWFMDYSSPGSSVHGILQSKKLEWISIPSSMGSDQPRNSTCTSYISCRKDLYY